MLAAAARDRELLDAAGNGTVRFLDLGTGDLLIGIGRLDRLLDLQQRGNRLQGGHGRQSQVFVDDVDGDRRNGQYAGREHFSQGTIKAEAREIGQHFRVIVRLGHIDGFALGLNIVEGQLPELAVAQRRCLASSSVMW